MKLVSYNIRFGLGPDQNVDLERIADTVNDADIIALQEVERYWKHSGMTDQPEIISSHLQQYYWLYFPAFDVDASEAQNDGSILNRRRQFGPMGLSRWPIRMARYYCATQTGHDRLFVNGYRGYRMPSRYAFGTFTGLFPSPDSGLMPRAPDAA